MLAQQEYALLLPISSFSRLLSLRWLALLPLSLLLYLAGHPSPSTISPLLLVGWPGWLPAPLPPSSGPGVNLLAGPPPSFPLLAQKGVWGGGS